MRSRFALVAMLIAAPPAFAESAKAPAACDPRNLDSREIAECLRLSSDASEKELGEVVAKAVKSIDGRAGLLSGQKSRWKRSLNESEAEWLAWRDTECQDVAPFEAGLATKGGDPRLTCLIALNARRIADIKARYP